MNKLPHTESTPTLSTREFDQQAWNRQQFQGALLTLLALVGSGFILTSPNYLPTKLAGIMLSIGPAVFMSGFLLLSPHSLRNSNGSLSTAIALIAFLWLIAVCTATATYIDVL